MACSCLQANQSRGPFKALRRIISFRNSQQKMPTLGPTFLTKVIWHTSGSLHVLLRSNALREKTEQVTVEHDEDTLKCP